MADSPPEEDPADDPPRLLDLINQMTPAHIRDKIDQDVRDEGTQQNNASHSILPPDAQDLVDRFLHLKDVRLIRKSFLTWLKRFYVACGIGFLFANLTWLLTFLTITPIIIPIPMIQFVDVVVFRTSLAAFLQMGWGFVFGGLFATFTTAIALADSNNDPMSKK